MKALRLAALLFVAIIPAACSQKSADDSQPPQPLTKVVPPTPKQTEKAFPVGTTWTAISLGGRTFSGERPSISIDQAFRGRGFGGCNNWSATIYPLREQSLAVGPIAVTKKTCAGGNASENAFFAALRSAQKWDIQGSILIMRTSSGDLRFNRSL